MFVVTEAEATAIRTAFGQSGELVAAVELCRLFPLITDTHAGGRVRSDHGRLEAVGHAAASGQASGDRSRES